MKRSSGMADFRSDGGQRGKGGKLIGPDRPEQGRGFVGFLGAFPGPAPVPPCRFPGPGAISDATKRRGETMRKCLSLAGAVLPLPGASLAAPFTGSKTIDNDQVT